MNTDTTYETELQTLSEQLKTLDEKRAAHRGQKAKHVELLARMLQHFPAKDQWKKSALRIVDDNECNGSYPPDSQYVDHSSTPLLKVRQASYSEDASGGGFYHDCTVGTADAGLYVTRDGEIWGAWFTGTCSFGQFPAHPGTCDRDITIDRAQLDGDDLTDEDYDTVIAKMKAML